MDYFFSEVQNKLTFSMRINTLRFFFLGKILYSFELASCLSIDFWSLWCNAYSKVMKKEKPASYNLISYDCEYRFAHTLVAHVTKM